MLLIARARRSAIPSAAITSSTSVGRRLSSASASPIPIQTSPSMPIRESQTKTSSRPPARWWTTQRSRWRSKPVRRSDRGDLLRLVDQLLEVEGLAEEAARAAHRRVGDRPLLDRAAEDEHRDRADAVALLDPAEHLPAVHLGH